MNNDVLLLYASLNFMFVDAYHVFCMEEAKKIFMPAYQNLHAATVDLLKLTKLEVIAVDYKFTLIEN